MKLIDPVYLRLVFSGVKSQRIDISNHHAIPDGVASFFEDIFRGEIEVNERRGLIEKFTYLALLQNGLDLNAISILSSINKSEWKKFVSQYAKYLNINALNQLSLFHQRFLVFLFSRSNEELVRRSARKIRDNIKALPDKDWVRENIGYYFFLNQEYKELFIHLVESENYQFQDWWGLDLSRLLDLVYLEKEITGIDFTKLSDLLRKNFDFSVQRKGVQIVVNNADKIDWDSLGDFFYDSRFQYELASEFSKNLDKLPDNWMEMMQNEDHPLSYTFSYVWKYFQYQFKEEPDREFTSKLWSEGSPYLRILVIMIWGYNRLNGRSFQWLDSLLSQNMNWQYLIEEKNNWDRYAETKVNDDNNEYLYSIKSKLEVTYHYIFENYWQSFQFIDRLKADVKLLWLNESSLQLALVLYRNPIWEISKIANEILVNRLRVKEYREEVIKWLVDVWENEELYALAELVFELKKIGEEDYFWFFVKKIINAKSCHIRGAFFSELTVFMEVCENKKFDETIFSELIPVMVENASDIWEIQELIRMFQYFLDAGITDPESALEYLHKIELLSHFKDPLAENYNDLWQYAEKIKGFK